MQGTVKFFDVSKGWGFITDSESKDLFNKDIFVHYSGLNMQGFKQLEEGQSVTFDVIDTEKGKQAVNVTVIENTSKEDFEKNSRYNQSFSTKCIKW